MTITIGMPSLSADSASPEVGSAPPDEMAVVMSTPIAMPAIAAVAAANMRRALKVIINFVSPLCER